MDPSRDDADGFESIVRSAVEQPDIASAAIFWATPGSTTLELVAAARVEGQALDALAAAVRDPTHPIARTLVDGTATFDVAPRAPGGPALRSHLPLLADQGGRRVARRVLAVAHERRLDETARQRLIELADQAAATSSEAAGRGSPPD